MRCAQRSGDLRRRIDAQTQTARPMAADTPSQTPVGATPWSAFTTHGGSSGVPASPERMEYVPEFRTFRTIVTGFTPAIAAATQAEAAQIAAAPKTVFQRLCRSSGRVKRRPICGLTIRKAMESAERAPERAVASITPAAAMRSP